jgi:hypothetical protein
MQPMRGFAPILTDRYLFALTDRYLLKSAPMCDAVGIQPSAISTIRGAVLWGDTLEDVTRKKTCGEERRVIKS